MASMRIPLTHLQLQGMYLTKDPSACALKSIIMFVQGPCFPWTAPTSNYDQSTRASVVLDELGHLWQPTLAHGLPDDRATLFYLPCLSLSLNIRPAHLAYPLPYHFLSHRYFSSENIAHLIPFWHLLLKEPRLTHSSYHNQDFPQI